MGERDWLDKIDVAAADGPVASAARPRAKSARATSQTNARRARRPVKLVLVDDHRLHREGPPSSLVYHELSTPLATALLYLRIAADRCATAGGEPARAAVVIAQAEIRRLQSIVDRVVELEREGRPHLRPARIDLGDLVRRTVDRSAALAVSGSSVTVVVRGDLTALWDQMAVEQIVTNLLSNALKFGAGRRVLVQVRATETGARLTVRDEGRGIPVEEHRRIFGRHVCAPRTEGGGLGLGLWLVRELSVAHGGSVTVSSRVGEGATFHVVLRSLRPEVPLPVPEETMRVRELK